MWSNNVGKITFIISIFLHCLLLAIPKFNLPKDTKKLDEVMVSIEVEKQRVLPVAGKVSKGKKLKKPKKKIQVSKRRILPKPEPKKTVPKSVEKQQRILPWMEEISAEEKPKENKKEIQLPKPIQLPEPEILPKPQPNEIVSRNSEKRHVSPGINKENKLKETKKEEQSSEHKVSDKPQSEEIASKDSESKPGNKITEAIDSNNETMLHYLSIVRQKIEEKKEYPVFARNQGIEGTVRLRVTISSNGQIDEIKIVKSSGEKILDQAAVSTITKASPFPSFPEDLKTSSMQVELSLVYTLIKK